MPPSAPAAAESQTSEGAAAFVEFYVDIYNYAYNTGRPSLLLPHHDDACRACSALVGLIIEPREETRYLTLTDVSATVAGANARVQTELVQAATDTSAEQQATTLFDLEWTGGGWQVNAITLAPR